MGKIDMIFWDVQHGNATYIKTPNGKNIVIDLGLGDYSGRNEQFSPLMELWHRYNVRKLDCVVITHPHLDHIDDILRFDDFDPSILNTPRNLTDMDIMNGVRMEDRPKFEKYCEIRNRFIHPVDSDKDFSQPANYGGVEFRYFMSHTLPTNNFNNHSVITVMEYEGLKVVMPGDNEFASLENLMQGEAFRDAVKDADILLAPHHGRESAYHSDFVTLVNPRLTIVSDGSICDTSANHRYSAKSRGWDVYTRGTGKRVARKCLTTNSDGEIFIALGNDGGRKYLIVQTL